MESSLIAKAVIMKRPTLRRKRNENGLAHVGQFGLMAGQFYQIKY